MNLDLGDCVFVCIDIQPRKRITWTAENVLETYRKEGFSLAELNLAVAHFHEVMLPNALRVARFAVERGIPRVFVHWAKEDARMAALMDIKPRPHDAFAVRAGDVVVAKTQMDAFASSNIGDVLERIGRRTLLLVGGHTRGCLGETARSAIREGYRCVVVRDATFDCSILRWPKGIAEVPYACVLDTAELIRGGR